MPYFNFKKLTLLSGLLAMGLSTSSYASMLGLCNDDANGDTQYICCPSSGGWIVSANCDAGASPSCTDNTGLIAGTNTSILQDCKNRGGNSLVYPA